MIDGKKIYISSCGGIGDLLMFTPALRIIKEQYPNATITFLTNLANTEILTGLPYIDRVITIQRGKAFSRLNAIKELFNQDYVIFTDWQPQLAFFAYLFGVPNRAGIPKPGHHCNKYFTKPLTHNVMFSPNYAAETNALIFSEALGISIQGDMTVLDVSQPSDNDKQSVDYLLENVGLQKDAQFICLAPFTGLEQRNWSIENSRIFVNLVKEHLKIPVVIIGPPQKTVSANEIGAYNLVGQTSLMEMTDIIRRAKLYIGSDSGPMHIAGAVNTPLVALFNKDIPSRWAPKNKCSVVTLDLECSPCNDETARKCKTVQCMRDITPEMVFDATKEAIDKYC